MACCSFSRSRMDTPTTTWCRIQCRATTCPISRGQMIDIVLKPFQFEFFRNGTMAAILVGGLCGLIGVYIVLRGMSYIGHGLSHAIFGGAVVSYVASVNFFLGAGLWGFAAALLVNGFSRRCVLGSDRALGVITAAGFAVRP